MKSKLITLIIMDGFGINEKHKGNPVHAAHKPNLESYFEEYPNTVLKASGNDVGLPEGQIGNSEVGHTNIGAGRIVYQNSLRITKSIESGDFFNKKEFLDAINYCKEKESKLHLLGLLSDGGVHSYNSHLYALLELAKMKNLQNVYIHCFLDGRDVPPDSGIQYIKELEGKIKEIGMGEIATVMGRYYAMDRDAMWDRVKLAYNAMVTGKGLIEENSEAAVINSYEKNEYDEFVKPTVILSKGKPVATIDKNDSVILFNFRGDRVREITRALVDKEFTKFKREKQVFPIHFVCMTEYDKTIDNVKVAYKPAQIENVFGEYISKLGYKQLRIAETTKYAHVTFFFNGGVEEPYEGEDRVLIPSPEVDTFDMVPEMSAYEITDEVIKRINSKKYDVIIMNYANGDMVGHSANMEPTIKAIKTVDECLGKVVSAVEKQNGIVIITADHGNAEQMIDYKNGGKMTAHTTNVVPFILIGIDKKLNLKEGRLADIAPTMLDVMNIAKPEEMTGGPLIR